MDWLQNAWSPAKTVLCHVPLRSLNTHATAPWNRFANFDSQGSFPRLCMSAHCPHNLTRKIVLINAKSIAHDVHEERAATNWPLD